MKKLTKLALVILTAGSFSFSSVVAGELSVTGGVTATYGMGEASSGIGVSNELDFNANGELDNGITWKWQTQLDNAAANNDDTSLVFGTSYGTVGLFITEGGLSSKYAYGAGALAAGSDYSAPADIEFGVNIDTYNNVQYHTPADLLPLGITAKIGYAPNLSDGEGASAKSKGALETKAAGDDLTHVRIDASPIAGLTVGADYSTVSGTLATTRYKQESAGAYAKYVAGPLTVGFSRTGYQPTKTTGATVTYETDSYGIKLAVNENLTISYGEEKSTKRTSSTLNATAVRTAATETDYEIEHIQAAYVIGGATLGVAIADGKNVAYTAGRQDKQTIFSLAMAF
jgi:hypothetical protein